jgi:hypothetical protein
MINEQIQEGFEVLVADADKPFGARGRVSPPDNRELVAYAENAGDLAVC